LNSGSAAARFEVNSMVRVLWISSFLCLATLLLVGLALFGADTQGVHSSLPNQLQEQDERRVQLEQELSRTETLRHARFDVLERYRAGVIDLDEVMARFRAFNEEQPLGLAILQNVNAGKTEEQYLGFQILVSASSAEWNRDDRDLFIRALITDLKSRMAGALLLPDAIAHLAPQPAD
jgi:hypothetical protein